MFTVLNRLRGMNGVWSKFNGLLLAYIVYSVSHNYYVALAVGIGYVIGESFGWGEWVGNLTTHRSKIALEFDEGKSNGIQWMARKIVPNYLDNWLTYCRVAMTIRGFYWAMPTLAPLYFVGFNPYVLLGCIVFLSIGFPLAYDLGYYLRDKISFEKFGLSFKGGWELGEGFYGLMQDLVLIGGICYVMV